MYQLNRDAEIREQLLFQQPYLEEQYAGGVRPFSQIGIGTLKKLLENHLIDPEDRQNFSPSAKEIIEFMEAYPFVKAHGYAVSPKRDDYRISLEGVEWEKDRDGGELTEEMVIDMMQLFRFADEVSMTLDNFYIWYD